MSTIELLASHDTALVVRVFSFSYKKGLPADERGQLTGLDQPVIDFLEEDGEIVTFLEHVYALADTHVERYIERGFTALMFSFGCTGGQHRSVYSAQHLAEHLHQKFGVEVRLVHREQAIETLFPATASR